MTVGGAIAGDIHGKSHHADGSFAQHVVSLELLLADGSVRTLTPEAEPELFWATAGGMGLTGVVVQATLRMMPVETSRIMVETRRVADLDEAMERMTVTDADYRFSVASLDNLATGPALGRGWVESAATSPPSTSCRRSCAPTRWRSPRSRWPRCPTCSPAGCSTGAPCG